MVIIIPRKKMVRLSEYEHKQLEKAKEMVLKKGIDNLPDITPVCPNCGETVDDFNIKLKIFRCPHCGFKKESKALILGAFALGTIVGLGAAVLIKLLRNGKKENNRE